MSSARGNVNRGSGGGKASTAPGSQLLRNSLLRKQEQAVEAASHFHLTQGQLDLAILSVVLDNQELTLGVDHQTVAGLVEGNSMSH